MSSTFCIYNLFLLSTNQTQQTKSLRVNNFINIHNSSSAKMLNDPIKILRTKLNDKSRNKFILIVELKKKKKKGKSCQL